MANVLLGVTGSVAAIRVPALFDALTAAGHSVKVVATQAATYFFDPATIGSARPREQPIPVPTPLEPAYPASTSFTPAAVRNLDLVILDSDEWPGRDSGRRYERGDEVLHIELRKWADVFAIAPLDANTLAKLAV